MVRQHLTHYERDLRDYVDTLKHHIEALNGHLTKVNGYAPAHPELMDHAFHLGQRTLYTMKIKSWAHIKEKYTLRRSTSHSGQKYLSLESNSQNESGIPMGHGVDFKMLRLLKYRDEVTGTIATIGYSQREMVELSELPQYSLPLEFFEDITPPEIPT